MPPLLAMPPAEQSSTKHTRVHPEASNSEEARRESMDEAVNVPLWLDQSAVANVAKRREAESMDIGMGYQMWVLLLLLIPLQFAVYSKRLSATNTHCFKCLRTNNNIAAVGICPVFRTIFNRQDMPHSKRKTSR